MKQNTTDVIWEGRQHWAWFPFSFTTFTLTKDRLNQQSGLLNTHYDETMLYKIIDICVTRSLFQKLFGTGTIILTTKADSQSRIYIKNIKDPMTVKTIISKAVEEERALKHVIGKELYSGRPIPGHDFHDSEFDPHPDPDDDDDDGR